ncbi:Eco57I restriction-modification methylase domain-containing protein [Flavobacterium litorale]|uniref:site-specific DNA-methyltransferase (adenine-specific) n=1 Tax=Flavobacterium litorale TaxID=2856519 RepID=A0ABX8V8R2_9FLAO|nr:TaqI-like C-terminal specificity domain-containing protein [Flavobacterium litorale]QYJ69240.1 N-6 DNA methylase [Flavobacterium litorale]
MPLFQNAVLTKYKNTQNKATIATQWARYQKHFFSPVIQQNIKNSKEEQYQGEFLIDLFVKILGYTKNPQPDFNLTTEYKNVKDSKKADGAILINNKVTAVIELKGTDTIDLGKVETQAFGYKNNQPDCVYVITANFEKLRFYIDNAVEHIEFNLFALTEQEFKLLYLCLAYENLSKGLPKQIKSESVAEEDKITKELYKDYSVFKTKLHHNLVACNPQYTPLELFKKSQKLLDRFLFLFFAEDRQLLPPNSVRLILNQWQQLQELDAYAPLYSRFKKYFGYLNTGFKGKQHDIYAYNGGLFKPDAVLDAIVIDDDLLYEHTLKLAGYDFASEIDVNILGHIFENSLNELEEVKAQLEGEVIDRTKTKRKKDGVFYTPKYITKYIVDNTVGKLCTEKKVALDISDATYQPAKQRSRKRLTALQEYREWLLQLTICDPACGSGAFLNQALDFLIGEHRYIDELSARYNKDTFVLSDVENSILENNLFGVDINEESVEIAKLSLWLRTARPKRKLNNLSNNIKCGNSLIDDPEVAGDKAFNWQHEFPHIFKRGGFDVVIGNPPYVFARDNFKQEEKDFCVKEYVSAKYQINTYLLFIEKSVKILKSRGVYGLIIPNAWLMVYSGEGLRKYLLDNCKLNQIINLKGYSFESANVETVILLAENQTITNPNSLDVYLNDGTEFYLSHTKNQLEFKNNEGFEFKVFLDDESDNINLKLGRKTLLLDYLVDIKAGLKAYEKSKGDPKQSAEDVKNRVYDYEYKFDENTHKYLDGKNVSRYFTNWTGSYLRYGKHLAAPRAINLFDGKKIIVREITGNFPKCIISTYTEDFYLYNMSNIAILEKPDTNISLKYILSILNSKLISYYFLKNTAKSVRKLFPKIILNDLRKFPIKKISVIDQQPFIEKADQMLTLNKELQEVSGKFQRSLQRKFELEKLPKKLQDWYELTYTDFVKELRKKKIKLSLRQEAEWEDYFTAEQQKAVALKTQIGTTDAEIDQMVYALYGLTPDEIAIVEAV